MRIVSFLAALALAALTFGACNVAPIVGSGDVVSQEFVVDEFDRIEIDGAWEASITAGELAVHDYMSDETCPALEF